MEKSIFYIQQNFPLANSLWEGIDNDFEVNFFKEKYIVKRDKKKIISLNHSFKIPSFFYPIILNWFKEKNRLKSPLSELVSVDFRKDWGMFFRAVHSLKEEMVLNTVKKISTFEYIMTNLSGKKLQMAESSFLLEPLPGFFIAYLFWEQDEEFPASLKILFDKKLADIFMQDMLWGVIVETNYRIKIIKNILLLFPNRDKIVFHKFFFKCVSIDSQNL